MVLFVDFPIDCPYKAPHMQRAWAAAYVDAKNGLQDRTVPFIYDSHPRRIAWLKGFDAGREWRMKYGGKS